MGTSCCTTMRLSILIFNCVIWFGDALDTHECDSFLSGYLCSLSPVDNIVGVLPNWEDEVMCQQECAQTSECNFFTYEKFTSGLSSCLLFKQCDLATVMSCHEEEECAMSVIGPVRPDIAVACCSGFFNGACPFSSLIREENDVNQEQICQNYCRENIECQFYTLFYDVCLLHSACENPSICDVCFSGPSFPNKQKCDVTPGTTVTIESTTKPSTTIVSKTTTVASTTSTTTHGGGATTTIDYSNCYVFCKDQADGSYGKCCGPKSCFCYAGAGYDDNCRDGLDFCPTEGKCVADCDENTCCK